jgi:hypothetical protein
LPENLKYRSVNGIVEQGDTDVPERLSRSIKTEIRKGIEAAVGVGVVQRVARGEFHSP